MAPLGAGGWVRNATFHRGCALFDDGYYWEAHEAWESLWIAHGRRGPVAHFLRGLIKLAAAGLKVRQGLGDKAAAFGAAAQHCFEQSEDSPEAAGHSGLTRQRLLDFAAYVQRNGARLQGDPTVEVEVVFAPKLLEPGREG